MSTDAERQRRSRAHRKGDHSLCDPARCDGHDVTASAESREQPQERGPATPRGLGSRGRRLWQDTDPAKLNPAQRVLLEEASRIADRLDRIDAILRGEEREWMRLRGGLDGASFRVVVDAVLVESRQQAVALKAIVSELRQGAGAAEQPKPEVSGLDDIARKRAERENKRRAAGL